MQPSLDNYIMALGIYTTVMTVVIREYKFNFARESALQNSRLNLIHHVHVTDMHAHTVHAMLVQVWIVLHNRQCKCVYIVMLI